MGRNQCQKEKTRIKETLGRFRVLPRSPQEDLQIYSHLLNEMLLSRRLLLHRRMISRRQTTIRSGRPDRNSHHKLSHQCGSRNGMFIDLLPSLTLMINPSFDCFSRQRSALIVLRGVMSTMCFAAMGYRSVSGRRLLLKLTPVQLRRQADDAP